MERLWRDDVLETPPLPLPRALCLPLSLSYAPLLQPITIFFFQHVQCTHAVFISVGFCSTPAAFIATSPPPPVRWMRRATHMRSVVSIVVSSVWRKRFPTQTAEVCVYKRPETLTLSEWKNESLSPLSHKSNRDRETEVGSEYGEPFAWPRDPARSRPFESRRPL